MKKFMKILRRDVNRLKWIIIDRVRPVIGKLYDLRDRILYEPIYYSYFSRDCDMYESSYCGVFTEGKKAFNKWLEHRYEGAEGPTYIDIISVDQYNNWLEETGGKASHRDRVMEAYENGRGNSIYV